MSKRRMNKVKPMLEESPEKFPRFLRPMNTFPKVRMQFWSLKSKRAQNNFMKKTPLSSNLKSPPYKSRQWHKSPLCFKTCSNSTEK